jgi:hypothetical protein
MNNHQWRLLKQQKYLFHILICSEMPLSPLIRKLPEDLEISCANSTKFSPNDYQGMFYFPLALWGLETAEFSVQSNDLHLSYYNGS